MGEIIHKGIVRKTVDGKLEVALIDGLECESCHIKGACNIGETRDNKVRMLEEHEGFEAGEEVSVHLSNELAFSALFWAYIFPFIVLFGALIILSLFMSE